MLTGSESLKVVIVNTFAHTHQVIRAQLYAADGPVDNSCDCRLAYFPRLHRSVASGGVDPWTSLQIPALWVLLEGLLWLPACVPTSVQEARDTLL